MNEYENCQAVLERDGVIASLCDGTLTLDSVPTTGWQTAWSIFGLVTHCFLIYWSFRWLAYKHGFGNG